jgi:hypothetical protein
MSVEPISKVVGIQNKTEFEFKSNSVAGIVLENGELHVSWLVDGLAFNGLP